MNLPRLLFLLYPAASASCLAVSYATAGRWPGAILSALTGVLFLVFHRRAARWVPTAFLLCILCLAVAGLSGGGSAFLMIGGVGLALATWSPVPYQGSPGKDANWRALVYPLAAIGPGLTLAAVGMTLSFRIPFFALLLLVVLNFLCIDRVFTPRERRRASNSDHTT